MNKALILLFTIALVGCKPGSAVDDIFGSNEESPIGNSALEFTPAAYNFGPVRAAADSLTKVVQVHNLVEGSVFISSINGGNSHYQVLTDTCPRSPQPLESDHTCTVTVRFSPQVSGTLSMALDVVYGSQIENASSFHAGTGFSGIGVSPLNFPGIDSIDQVQCSTVRLNWTQVSDAGAYLIFEDISGAQSLVGSVSGAASYTVTGLTGGTTHTYKVLGSDLLGVLASNTATQTVTTQPSPTLATQIDRVFPSNHLTQGSAMPQIDFNNTQTNDDVNMSYSCVFDTTIDGTVSSGTACTSLPGTATFDSTTGIFNWTPDTSALGAYEVKVSASLYGECATQEVFVLNVIENFSLTNLVALWDPLLASGTSPNMNVPLTRSWKNLSSAGSALNGTFSAGSWDTTAWKGDASTPYSLTFTGTNSNYVNFGNQLSSQNNLMFNVWVKPKNATQTGSVILGTGGGANDGFVLRQSTDYPGQMEFVVGNTATVSSDTLIQAKNPVGYWKLDETSGTAIADSSPNGLSGVAGTGVTLNQSPALAGGKSVRMNGSGTGVINVADSASLALTGDFSIALWVYPTSSSGYQAMVAKGDGSGNGYSFLLTFDNGTLFPSMYMSNVNADWSKRSTVAANLNQWNHVVATYNNTTKQIIYYVNGVAGTPIATSGGASPVTTTVPLKFGNMLADNYPLNGYLDEIAIFPSVLSASDVDGLYKQSPRCLLSTPVQDDTWYLISGLHDNTTHQTQLFMNGSLQCSSINATGVFAPGSTDFVVGAKSDGSSAWTGEIGLSSIHSTGNSSYITDFFYTTASRYRSVASIATPGLVAFFDAKLATGSGFAGTGCAHTSWFDLSSSNLTATLQNFSSCGAASGWNGSSTVSDPYRLQFSRSGSDYVTIPHNSSLNISGDISITVVIKPTASIADYQGIIGKGTGSPNYGFLYAFDSSTLQPTLYLSGANTTWSNKAQTSLTVNTWNVITVTFDSATKSLKYYLNGAPDGSYTTSGSVIDTNSAQLEIGAMISNMYSLDASIAAIAIYNRPLTTSEVKLNCRAYELRVPSLTCSP